MVSVEELQYLGIVMYLIGIVVSIVANYLVMRDILMLTPKGVFRPVPIIVAIGLIALSWVGAIAIIIIGFINVARNNEDYC